MRCCGQAVNHHGDCNVIAGTTSVGIVGLYQIIYALADVACIETVVGGGVVAVDPAADSGIGARNAGHLDVAASTNLGVAVYCRYTRYRDDGGSDSTSL